MVAQRMRRLLFLTVAPQLLGAGAQAADEQKEPIAIPELGAAAERTFPNDVSSFGPR